MHKYLTDKEIQEIIRQDKADLQKHTFFDQLILLLRDEESSRQKTLQQVCDLIPSAWRLPAHVSVRISFDGNIYVNTQFAESDIRRIWEFRTNSGVRGVLEIFHLKDFREIHKVPYKREEKQLMERISRLLVYYIENIMPEDVHSDKLEKIFASERSSLRSLSVVNQVALVLKESVSLKSALHQIAFILPEITQFPNFTGARILFDGQIFSSKHFHETPWYIAESINNGNQERITLEVFMLGEFPRSSENPFLRNEKLLLKNIARLIHNYLKSNEGRQILNEYEQQKSEKEGGARFSTESKALLQNFLNRSNYERDIYHDLMPFKVKEILIVANLYDAFSIEKEGRFSEYILGQYHQLNLTSLPRITGASGFEEARDRLNARHFDMVIVMMGANKKDPLEISRKLKDEFNYIPIFLLLNNNSDAETFRSQENIPDFIDEVFAWNGDSRIFFAMVKLLEDKMNAENDTRLGMARIILLVEDSVSYYSRYLPLLYSAVMNQTKRIIDDVSEDELYKVLRLRGRPKILLASNYEEALSIFNKYRSYLLCLISDVTFERKGVRDKNAGFYLVEHVKQAISNLPVAMQSSRPENEEKAKRLNTYFINKNSQSLQHDIHTYISFHLGFGNFHFRDNEGNHIATARNLGELEASIRTVPESSLLYHARNNHFSLWLKARGEIEIARLIAPYTIYDFKSSEDIRQLLLSILDHHRREKQKGKVVDFSELALTEECSIVMLAAGSLGGKGRGVAFINTLLNYFDFSQYIPNINIKLPRTAIIGNNEFADFLQENDLFFAYTENDFEFIKQRFVEADLSVLLVKRLRTYLQHIKQPIAVRSSGLFEDSLMQPFAGIFSTYLLPNNHPDIDKRLAQLMTAIKLVYASVFSDLSRSYLKAINYKVDDERMAVVVQELVGETHGNYFYPHISGVAQSYNYYPHGYIKPEDGFAIAALGLGKYVVEGKNAYRFTPKYPNTRNYSTKELFKNSQVEFLALNLSETEPDLLKHGEDAGIIRLSIDEAEQHGTLKHLASVYDPDDDRMKEGLENAGPRVINFADILKHNYIPMAGALQGILDVIQEAFGTAVEIEYAVDLNKDRNGQATFYMLQIKPLVGTEMDTDVQIENYDFEHAVLYSENSMGHGRIPNIRDVIYVPPERFDKMKTLDMADEIEAINAQMEKENKWYVLIGPGRWGSSDNMLGIPVRWAQISKAKMIVELGWENFILDASLGSHFFHNVTSMKVGYLSVHEHYDNEYIRWDILQQQELVQEYTYFRHVRFPQPLSVVLDGKKQIAVIQQNHNQ